MRYSNSISQSRINYIKSLIDAGSSNGKLQIMDGSTVLASFMLYDGTMTHSGRYNELYVSYCTYVSTAVQCVATGTANKARVVDSDNNVIIDDIPVFIPHRLELDSNAQEVYSMPRMGIAISRLKITNGDFISISQSYGASAVRNKFWLSSI